MICDVCGKPGKGVASSSLGPVSFCYCQVCLNCGAEPLGMWHVTFDCVGGPTHLREDLVVRAISYKDDHHIGWKEIVSSYVPNLIDY